MQVFLLKLAENLNKSGEMSFTTRRGRATPKLCLFVTKIYLPNGDLRIMQSPTCFISPPKEREQQANLA